MATKKQKRAAGIAKHEAFLEEMRRSGLEAQRKDRERKERMLLQEWQDQHDKKHSWKKVIDECPHCQLVKKAQNQSRRQIDEAIKNPGEVVGAPSLSFSS
jgi:hypothetical protein